MYQDERKLDFKPLGIAIKKAREAKGWTQEYRIDGTEKFGRAWMIPKDAEKPVDGRMKTRNKQEENHGI